MQLDQAARGFSFQSDGPLDMRMEQAGESAADFVNTADEADIADIIYRYGDEPKSRRIARAIVAARPVTRTAELASVVRRAVGWREGQKSDPATRTFTFHSLEDRIVKRFLRERSGQTPAGSRHLPDVAGRGSAPTFEAVAKPVRASEAELTRNPRARSATLRVARRTAHSSSSANLRGAV